VARTDRSRRTEREENTIARLLDIVEAVEVLAALHPDASNRRRCAIILAQVEAFRADAIERRNERTSLGNRTND
jgi:hypothetical protein